MKIFTYICAIFLLFLGISFSLLNSSDVTVNYFLGKATLPTSFLVIISIAIGAVISLFFCMFGIVRHKATIYGLKRKVEFHEKAAQRASEITKE